MARRRSKKRTHIGANNGPSNSAAASSSASRAPKSMVIRIGAGEVGPSVSQLVKDVRSMLEPGTASKLKVADSSVLYSISQLNTCTRSERRTDYEIIQLWPDL